MYTIFHIAKEENMENWLNINYSGENIIIELFIYFIILKPFQLRFNKMFDKLRTVPVSKFLKNLKTLTYFNYSKFIDLVV